MNKRYICQMLKRWSLLGGMALALSVMLISSKQIVWAQTSSLQIVNYGLYEEGKEECFVAGTDQEEQVPWMNSKNGKVIWKVLVHTLQESVKAEVFRGEETVPLETYVAAGEYEIEIPDKEYSGIYRLVVTDAEGNKEECRQYVKIDRQAPIPDEILISFQASELDRNSISYEDIEKNPIKKLQNFINHLFAKKRVTATFYAQEAVKLKFSYQDEKEYELNSKDGYFSVELPVENSISANEIAGRIMITEVEDAAGNVCRLETGKEIKTQGMIILDDVAPVLSNVSYTPLVNSQTIGTFDYYFYQSSAKAVFEIIETNFEGVLREGDDKRLPVYSGEINGAWAYDSQTRTATSTIEFSEAEGEEREYAYSLFYMDPSGNFLMGTDKFVCTEGRYQKDIVVIDQRPPHLKAFLIESNSETKFMEEDGITYAANVEGDDLKITIRIDDHENYFDKENVLLEYSADGKEWRRIKGKVDYSAKKRNHELIYTFDGEKNAEAVYQFRVSYKDRAGNVMIVQENSKLPVKESDGGTYTSTCKVVIDHVNPKLNIIKFTKPVQMYQEDCQDGNGELTTIIKNKNSKLYYAESTEISLNIEELFLKNDGIGIQLYYRANKGALWKEWEGDVPDLRKERKNAGIKIDFMLPEVDAEYYFTISYTDRAGNPMVYGDTVEQTKLGEAYYDGIIKNTDSYSSPIFVRDNKEPVYEILYNQKPEKYNSVDCVEMQLNLWEVNLDGTHTMIKISAKDINGKPIAAEGLKGFEYDVDAEYYRTTWEALLESIAASSVYPDAAEVQTFKLKLSTEANYEIFVEMIDKAGRKTSYKNAYCIDRTPPSINVVTKDGQCFTDMVKVSCGLLDFSESDITYTVVDGGVIDRIIDKLTFGYFSKSKLSVHVKVHDQISGVEHLVPTCINEGDKKVSYKLSEQIGVKDDKGTVKYEIELPVDFKGTVQMHGIDYAENEAKDTGAIGMISETERQHKKCAKSSIEVLTPYSKTPNYYAGDVEVKYYAEDQYSGLGMVNYQAGKHKETITYAAGEEICTEMLKKHTISAKENQQNHVNLALEFFDNAGHEEKLTKERIPTVHIDQTSPKIQVVYDNLEVQNEKYYKADRTATITITERNFDSEDTNLYITGPSVEITDWRHLGESECKAGANPANTNHGNDCKWVAKIHFSKDGEYTFTCDTTDLAGNKSTYGSTDAFVIDKTRPEIKVTYDNHEVKNGSYYKAPRTATIEIKELHFKETDVKIKMKAVNDEEILSVPAIGSWKSEGDMHQTTIDYDYDAQFEFEIAYTDLAGNQAASYEKEYFIVDLTVPEIEFFDIWDHSANSGVVAPGIRYHDRNYDIKGIELELTGYQNGSVKMKYSQNEIQQGMELKLEDFAHLPEMDDLYILKAVVYDLAGNRSEKKINFSVNRFGSIYSFDDKTEALVGNKGSYYTKEEPEIVVYETNADALEFREITLNFNGKLKTLIENIDFKVHENGNDEGWKRYTYEIAKENFLEDGIYILTIYSEDRAQNLSDNDTKGKKIEFVVDKSSPSILITGIENDKQYREASKEITIDVEDNVCIGTVEVSLNGEKTIYSAIEIAKVNGRMSYLMKSENDWQILQVTAYDTAGNVAHSEKFKVLITPNILVQMYRNTPVFYMSVGALVIFAGGIVVLLQKNKEKKEVSSS